MSWHLVPARLPGTKFLHPVVSHFSSFFFYSFLFSFSSFSHFLQESQSQAHTNFTRITSSQHKKTHRNRELHITDSQEKKPSGHRRAPAPAVERAAAEGSASVGLPRARRGAHRRRPSHLRAVAGERLRQAPTRLQGRPLLRRALGRPQGSAPPPRPRRAVAGERLRRASARP